MNMFTRVGLWLENHKKAKAFELEILDNRFVSFVDGCNQNLASVSEQIADLRSKIPPDLTESILAHTGRLAALENDKQVPSQLVKEIALLKVRLDQMELYVGLKREPKPEHVPGTAKIS